MTLHTRQQLVYNFGATFVSIMQKIEGVMMKPEWINSLSLSDTYGDIDLSQQWLLYMLTSSKVFCGIHLRAISVDVLVNLVCNMCLEITFLKLLPHLSEAK